MRRFIEFLIALGIGAGVVWFITRPRMEELKRKIRLLEERVYELHTRYEDDFNTITEEYNLLYNQIRELKKTALSPQLKNKVEKLLFELEQIRCQD